MTLGLAARFQGAAGVEGVGRAAEPIVPLNLHITGRGQGQLCPRRPCSGTGSAVVLAKPGAVSTFPGSTGQRAFVGY